MRHILIIDNHLRQFCNKCSIFRDDVVAKYRAVVRRHDELPESLDDFTHIVLTGGGGQVNMGDPSIDHLKKLIRRASDEAIPMLGVCFGHQMIAATLGGDDATQSYVNPETGWFRIHRLGKSRLLSGLPEYFYSFEHHHDDVIKLSADFLITARSKRCPIQAFEHKTLPIFGVQFHPEMSKRQAKTLIAQHINRHMPTAWLGVNKRGRMPFSRHIGEVVFDNFYAIKRPIKTKV